LPQFVKRNVRTKHCTSFPLERLSDFVFGIISRRHKELLDYGIVLAVLVEVDPTTASPSKMSIFRVGTNKTCFNEPKVLSVPVTNKSTFLAANLKFERRTFYVLPSVAEIIPTEHH
jgi:hypothetical protein